MDEKILLSSFTVKPETRPIDKFFLNDFFPSTFDSYSRQYIYSKLWVFPQLSKISKFINLYIRTKAPAIFHRFTNLLENTSGSHSGCAIPESIVSHFSSFLSCVLTRQWVNFTAAYMTFENTSPFLSLSLSMIQQLWSSSLTYIPSSLIGVMTISRWCHRPTDVTTTPLRDHWEQPRFYIFPSLSYSRSSSSRPSQLLRALYLFRKLNGRVLSHSCGYSFRQRAWPSFRDIRTSRISGRFAILERMDPSCLPFDPIISLSL